MSFFFFHAAFRIISDKTQVWLKSIISKSIEQMDENACVCELTLSPKKRNKLLATHIDSSGAPAVVPTFCWHIDDLKCSLFSVSTLWNASVVFFFCHWFVFSFKFGNLFFLLGISIAQ